MSQLADWKQKNQQIHDTERDLAGILARTPYVLLLSHSGINVVSAAELAGETGPIENYATAKAVCGRAGLFPARYQSDEVDRSGKLTRSRNAKLRAAWLMARLGIAAKDDDALKMDIAQGSEVVNDNRLDNVAVPMAAAVSVLTSCPREMRKVSSKSMALCRELNVG
jgi:transposase